MSLWLPGYERLAGVRSGAIPRSDGPPKGVAHTDEVGRNTRSMALRHDWPPQLWVNPRTLERYQLIALDRTGYALKASPHTETNHQGRVIQVEIAGHARDTHLWGDDIYRWLALEVFRPIWEVAGVPLVAHRDVGLPSSEAYGKHAPSRMSIPEWQAFSGWCAHQNVPDNDHWDAGQLPLGRILTLAAPQEDDMAVQTVIGQDRQKRWWSFKNTSPLGVELTQDEADFWYMVDPSMYTGDPDLIERLKRANGLVPLSGGVVRS